MPRESSIGSELFEKVQFLVKIPKISKNLENLKKSRCSCSTSYPSGNQVDSSPLIATLNHIELAQLGTREHP